MSEDPMADFLARERAALGEEADLFQSGGTDNISEAIVPDDQPPNISDASAIMPSLESEDRSEFLSPTPSIGAISTQSVSVQSPSVGGTEFEQEWQSKQREVIAERDSIAEEKHKDIVNEARNAIDKFYEEYNRKKDEAIEENRANQEIESQAANKGNLWERAVRQIDMATKGSSTGNASPRGDISTPRVASPTARQQQTVRDTSRMRDLLHDLKRDPDAPGIKAKATS
ncbi:Clathrin light chain [Coemansia sp. RSA 1365]|nr:Clathrin light chain [Coemansia sp. RSA 1365]